MRPPSFSHAHAQRVALIVCRRFGTVSVTSLADALGVGFPPGPDVRERLELALREAVGSKAITAAQWLGYKPMTDDALRLVAIRLVREHAGVTIRWLIAETASSKSAVVRVLRVLVRAQVLAVAPLGSRVPYVRGPKFDTVENTDAG